MNYEQSKFTVEQLKMDTVGLRLAIRKLKASNNDYRSALDHYETTLIPLQDSIQANLEKEVRLQIRKGNLKSLKIGGITLAVGVVVGIIFF